MSSETPFDPDDPYGPYLQAIAAQGVRIAARMEARVMDAKTAEEEAGAAIAWTKVTRGLRQTLALHARLHRERQAFRRDFGPQMAKDHAQQVARRVSQVHDAVEAEIYSEYEKPDDRETAGYLIGDLFDIMREEAENPAFLDEPVARQINRIRHLLGLGEFADACDEAADDDEGPDSVATADSS